MPVIGEQVAVDTSADLIVSGAGSIEDPRPVTLLNGGSTDCFLGGSGVTTAGFKLAAGASIGVTLPFGDNVYGITASGSTTIHVLRGRS